MFGVKTVHLFLSLVFCSSLTVFGQWSAANSGTTNNLNGVYLLDSGIAFVVGDDGTILKSTDAGATWAPLMSGTTNILHDVYFFDANQGVAVGEQGLILRTTDGGADVAERRRAAWRTLLDPSSLVGQTGFRAAIRKRLSTRLTPAPRGKSAKAGFSAAVFQALIC